MLNELIYGITFFLQVFIISVWSYWFLVSLFGIGKVYEPKLKEPKNKFLLLIPAHNEEKVIGSLVRNLKQLDYPEHLYDIYVIADNCNDNTSIIAKERGAFVVEHFYKPNEPKGKPYAIKYALDFLKGYENKYDAVCVFDADNLVSLNYLKKMNNHLERGDNIIQTYLDSKNPSDNWISLAYSTSFYYINRSWQLARERLGLGNAIGGTGFCVRANVLKMIGWNVRSLTEDLEFQMECLLHNISVNWCHTARVYDEKPTEIKASIIQRLRWTRGHWDVCFRYSGKLFKKAIKDKDILALDGVFYLINPGKIVLATLLTLMSIFSTMNNLNWFFYLFPWYIWASTFAVEFLYVGYTIIKDTNQPLRKILGLIYMPIFNYLYSPLFIYALLTIDNKNWVRTEHTKNVTMDNISA